MSDFIVTKFLTAIKSGGSSANATKTGIPVLYKDQGDGTYAEVVSGSGGGGGGGGDASAANQVLANTKLDTLHSDIGTKVTAVTALGAGGTGIIGWLSNIWDKLNSGIPNTASEAHIGQVGGETAYIDLALTTDTSIYASGEVLFDTVSIPAAMRANDKKGVLQSIVVIDEDDQGIAMDLVFLSANSPLGTVNIAPTITDANARNILGIIPIAASDYVDLGGVRIATKSPVGLVVKPVTGAANLYVAGITRGTPTHTAAGLRLRLGFLQD